MNTQTSTGEMAIPAEVLDLEARARRIETPCGDGTMVWRAWGEGEPVALAHGAQGDWTHWIRNIDALSQDRMVLAPDLPGHGDSALPVTSDHHGISEALAAGLKQIFGEGRPIDLIGFSFGGVCFAQLAARHPEVVKRVIIVGCGGLGTPNGPIDIGPVRGLEGEARLARLKANLLGLMLHNPENVDDFAIWQLVTKSRRARIVPFELVMPDKIKSVMPQIKAPLDAIWGECDRPHPYPPMQKDALTPFQPDIDFRVIKGAGHWAMFDGSEQFNSEARDMLANPRAARA